MAAVTLLETRLQRIRPEIEESIEWIADLMKVDVVDAGLPCVCNRSEDWIRLRSHRQCLSHVFLGDQRGRLLHVFNGPEILGELTRKAGVRPE